MEATGIVLFSANIVFLSLHDFGRGFLDWRPRQRSMGVLRWAEEAQFSGRTLSAEKMEGMDMATGLKSTWTPSEIDS